MTSHADSSLPVTVYTPASPLRNPGTLLKEIVRDLWRGRGLAVRLFLRDTAALYRQSVLGYLWAFVPPLATAGTFIFLNSQRILTVGTTPIAYAAYVIIGTVLWQTFLDALNSPMRAVGANMGLLVKVNFPREALLLAGLFDVLFNLLIRVTLVVPVFWLFDLPLTSSVLLFPVGIGAIILLGFSIGVFLTPLGLLYSDVGRTLSVVTAFWFFLTPVIYPPPTTGFAAYVTKFNPVSPVIVTARDWLISQSPTHLLGFGTITAFAFTLLIVSCLIYHIALPHLIERMGG